jgi:hypothetical protein
MISPELKKVILKQLDLDDFDLQDETIAPQVPGWDSLILYLLLKSILK